MLYNKGCIFIWHSQVGQKSQQSLNVSCVFTEITDNGGYVIKPNQTKLNPDSRVIMWWNICWRHSFFSSSMCLLYYKYILFFPGNNWNFGPDGKGCMGCGQQEEFYSCADVAIIEEGQSIPTLPPRKHVTKKLINKPNNHGNKGSEVNNDGCHAIGNWKGIPTMDSWCNENCPMGNCPSNTCKCKWSIAFDNFSFSFLINKI